MRPTEVPRVFADPFDVTQKCANDDLQVNHPVLEDFERLPIPNAETEILFHCTQLRESDAVRLKVSVYSLMSRMIWAKVEITRSFRPRSIHARYSIHPCKLSAMRRL